jgi:aspartate ammonia-lyase
MPGKVNPVIPEVVNQVAFEVIGNDMTVTMAAEAGQLQLNAFEPIIACSLFDAIHHLRQGAACSRASACTTSRPIAARLDELVRNTIGIVTALNPYLGYEKTTELARKRMRRAGACTTSCSRRAG